MASCPRLRFLAAFSILSAFTGCSGIERSLIFPGTVTQGRPETVVEPSASHEMIDLTLRDGTKLVAQFGRALDAPHRPLPAGRAPTLIYFYGNGSCLAFSGEQFQAFRRLGVNVLIPEYPGYGMSEGAASERSLYETADVAYDYLLTRADVDPHNIMVIGWSMGGAVAIDLSSRRPVTRLVTLSAFTTMTATARNAAPWAPTSLLIRSRFDNLAKIGSVPCPILLVHGQQDSLVPPRMADELAAQPAPFSRRVLLYRDAAHNDIFAVGGAALMNEIRAFLLTD